MKLFLSWSKEFSRTVAHALHDWLPLVVQHIDLWMSDEAIGSGARWNEKIAHALEQADFGIICVTAAHQHEPWLLFEAGALAKRLDAARVVPVCVDITPSEVTGPLSSFQARTLDEDGTRRLVQDISAARADPLTPEQVAQLFTATWPLLQARVSSARESAAGKRTQQRGAQRSTDEMLEELVERVRRLDREEPYRQGPGADPGLVDSVYRQITDRAAVATEKDSVVERLALVLANPQLPSSYRKRFINSLGPPGKSANVSGEEYGSLASDEQLEALRRKLKGG